MNRTIAFNCCVLFLCDATKNYLLGTYTSFYFYNFLVMDSGILIDLFTMKFCQTIVSPFVCALKYMKN